jgi:hypothetical protein
VLIRLARQKKSGSIVLDGRRSTPSCRWSTFSSTVQTAPQVQVQVQVYYSAEV